MLEAQRVTPMDFRELLSAFSGLSEANRPIRLRLSCQSTVFDDLLLAKHVSGTESICGGIEYRILCASTNAAIPLKEFIGIPAELQFVTDRGELRSVCGIVAQAGAGQSDGGLATYQLVVRDALAMMEMRTSTRVFRNASEIDISDTLLQEWRSINPILAKAFDIDTSALSQQYPAREFTMQHNESDASFLRRLWKRQGVSWFVRPGVSSERGSTDTPAHTLVLFDRSDALQQNASGTVRFHRDAGTETADSVFNWSASRTLRPGALTRQSWDYCTQGMTTAEVPTTARQGDAGDQFAYSLDDYVIDAPHLGDDQDDYRRIGEMRMRRHEFEAKTFHGESGVRNFRVGEWFELVGHPEVDLHADDDREFVVTELAVDAENSVPKELTERIHRLFDASGWKRAGIAGVDGVSAERNARYTNRFACVRRTTPIVPYYDPRADLPRVTLQSAIVVGPPGEEVHCDSLGRVKIRFPGTREQDHAQGPGASNTDADSAWVRVATTWASERWGAISLPRVGDEVLVDFLGGDPDKPIVVACVYGRPPAAFSHQGELPGNRFVAGIKSKEVKGFRYNQLRLDDSPGQINAQLASEHAHSELNLGWLTRPRVDGKGDARGEGAELRSDQAVSVRGKRGVLISADGQDRADGPVLEREALLGLGEVLKSVQRQLSELSATHNAGAGEGAKLDDLVERLRKWDAGTNVDADGAGGGAPVVAISAPAGIAVNSHDNLLLGSQSQTDMISVGDTQVSAGKRLLLRAAEAVSVFAHKLGMKLVAASGKMELQTHDGNIELTSARRIVLNAAEEIVLQAPSIRFVAKGAQVDIGADQIVQQCTGTHTIKSAKFAHVAGGGGKVSALNLPTSKLVTDERVVLFDQQTGEPVPNRSYRAVLDDGQVVSGKTDAEGRTALMQSATLGELHIFIDSHSDET
jgi:type VI secretion system secreted protein VgrG